MSLNRWESSFGSEQIIEQKSLQKILSENMDKEQYDIMSYYNAH